MVAICLSICLFEIIKVNWPPKFTIECLCVLFFFFSNSAPTVLPRCFNCGKTVIASVSNSFAETLWNYFALVNHSSWSCSDKKISWKRRTNQSLSGISNSAPTVLPRCSNCASTVVKLWLRLSQILSRKAFGISSLLSITLLGAVQTKKNHEKDEQTNPWGSLETRCRIRKHCSRQQRAEPK